MLDELLLSGLRKDLEVARGIKLRNIVRYVESDTKREACFRCCYSVMNCLYDFSDRTS